MWQHVNICFTFKRNTHRHRVHMNLKPPVLRCRFDSLKMSSKIYTYRVSVNLKPTAPWRTRGDEVEYAIVLQYRSQTPFSDELWVHNSGNELHLCELRESRCVNHSICHHDKTCAHRFVNQLINQRRREHMHFAHCLWLNVFAHSFLLFSILCSLRTCNLKISWIFKNT